MSFMETRERGERGDERMLFQCEIKKIIRTNSFSQNNNDDEAEVTAAEGGIELPRLLLSVFNLSSSENIFLGEKKEANFV